VEVHKIVNRQGSDICLENWLTDGGVVVLYYTSYRIIITMYADPTKTALAMPNTN
jgi:hypothetical protein